MSLTSRWIIWFIFNCCRRCTNNFGNDDNAIICTNSNSKTNGDICTRGLWSEHNDVKKKICHSYGQSWIELEMHPEENDVCSQLRQLMAFLSLISKIYIVSVEDSNSFCKKPKANKFIRIGFQGAKIIRRLQPLVIYL